MIVHPRSLFIACVAATGAAVAAKAGLDVPPSVSNCGTGASMSAQATDFVGQVTTGSSLVTSCTITFSKLYSSFGCIAQSNAASSSPKGSWRCPRWTSKNH